MIPEPWVHSQTQAEPARLPIGLTNISSVRKSKPRFVVQQPIAQPLCQADNYSFINDKQIEIVSLLVHRSMGTYPTVMARPVPNKLICVTPVNCSKANPNRNATVS